MLELCTNLIVRKVWRSIYTSNPTSLCPPWASASHHEAYSSQPAQEMGNADEAAVSKWSTSSKHIKESCYPEKNPTFNSLIFIFKSSFDSFSFWASLCNWVTTQIASLIMAASSVLAGLPGSRIESSFSYYGMHDNPASSFSEVKIFIKNTIK